MAEILIKSLRKNYHKTAVLHGIDLAIQDGEFIAILGPSGCGKSTLLRMIAGLESVSAGTIEIDGKVVNELEPRERNCAMVFQNYALYPHMSVSDNIGYALKVAGVSRTERESRILKVAKSVGLETFLNRKPGELSGGQRQRVAMARAIIREPGVFLFDEPLSNLDAKLRGQMRHEVRRIHNQIGATSVFVTHDQQEGMTMADRMVIMKEGYVEQIGAPKAIYDQPQTLFVAGFVGPYPMNFIEAKQIGNTLHLPNAVTLPIANAAPERTVTVGLRPETLKVVPPEQGDCQCRLEFAEELGIGQLCHLDYEGNTIMALAEGWDHSLVAGETLGLQFGAIHVFDHETGKRIVN